MEFSSSVIVPHWLGNDSSPFQFYVHSTWIFKGSQRILRLGSTGEVLPYEIVDEGSLDMTNVVRINYDISMTLCISSNVFEKLWNSERVISKVYVCVESSAPATRMHTTKYGEDKFLQ